LRPEGKYDEFLVAKDQFKEMIEKGHKFFEDWKNVCPATEHHNLGLEAARQKVEEQHASTRTENEALKEQVAYMQEEKKALEFQLKEQEQKIQKLRAQAATYRNIVIKRGCSDNAEMDDASITKTFTDLRAIIQKIVHKHCHLDPQIPPTTNRKLSSDQKKFLKFWDEKCSTNELQFRLRAEIFSMIYKSFLSKPSYGLEAEPTRHLEEGLVNFEQALQKTGAGKNGSSSMIISKSDI
jgi:molecular chaperone GrpE (heat shock protein)